VSEGHEPGAMVVSHGCYVTDAVDLLTVIGTAGTAASCVTPPVCLHKWDVP
jgi:hypothetical protein